MIHRRFLSRAVAAAVLGAMLVFPLAAAAREKYEQKIEKVEALDKDGKVLISNLSGSIDVLTWAEAQVKIEAVKVAEAKSLDRAKEDAEKVQIVIEKTGNILRIESKYPDSRGHNDSLSVSVRYRLWIPEKASVKITSVSGGVTASGVGGTLEIRVTSGRVLMTKISGEVDCTVTSGTVTASDISADLNLRTISGGIEVERVKGSIEAETTSGKIRMHDVSGARFVRAKVLSGGITYDGDLMKDGKYSLEAMSGRIEMTIPANAGFELDAETFSGGLQTDFPVTVSGRLSAKEIHGLVNQGGATVRLKSFSGSIALKKK